MVTERNKKNKNNLKIKNGAIIKIGIDI